MKNTIRRLILAALALLLCFILFGCDKTDDPAEVPDTKPVETEPEETKPAETEPYVQEEAARSELIEVTATLPAEPVLYVSTTGTADGDGTEARPFANPAQAVAWIHSLREQGYTDALTVNILPGKYAVASLVFAEEDGGPSLEDPVVYRAYGDGEVILTAASGIPEELFAPLSNEKMLSLVSPEAAGKIVQCDLAEAGFTPEQVGGLYGYGVHTSASVYPEYVGTNNALFAGDTRLTLARYPDQNEDPTMSNRLTFEEGSVLDSGDSTHGGTLRLPDAAAERIESWSSLDGVWMDGYFSYDWVEEPTPVESYDPETKGVTLLFPCWGGYRAEEAYCATFNFFNVPEELDAPGEYYIDRDAQILYLYPTEDGLSDVYLSCTHNPLISGTLKNVTFEGLTIEGVGDTVASPEASNGVTFRKCTVRNCEGNFFMAYGNHNTVYGCEIYNMGVGGVSMTGGDFVTLEPSGNLIENNYLHDIGQVTRVYHYGFDVRGVGGDIRYNEISNAPHAVLSAWDMDHVIEWNYIHHVVMDSSDAGAFYMGGQWYASGNIIRNNKFEDIGAPGSSPKAVYLDDLGSGFTITSNVIIGCRGFAMNFGGGRCITATNNLVILGEDQDGGYLHYDDRIRDYYNEGAFGSKEHAIWTAPGPYQNEVYQETHPLLAQTISQWDYDDPDDPDFLVNPAHSVVKDNIFIGEWAKWKYIVEPYVEQYSEIGNYVNVDTPSRIFEEGTYEFNKIGQRQKIDYTPIAYDGYGTYDD